MDVYEGVPYETVGNFSLSVDIFENYDKSIKTMTNAIYLNINKIVKMIVN